MLLNLLREPRVMLPLLAAIIILLVVYLTPPSDPDPPGVPC